MLATRSIVEKRCVRHVGDAAAFIARRLTVSENVVLQAKQLPDFLSHLASGLSQLDRDHLSWHDPRLAGSNSKVMRTAKETLAQPQQSCEKADEPCF